MKKHHELRKGTNAMSYIFGFAIGAALLSGMTANAPTAAATEPVREANLSVMYVEAQEDQREIMDWTDEYTPSKAPEWEPDPEDVAYISRTIWGEVRGCTVQEQEAVAWCILNRVDDPRFQDTVMGVVTAKYQWQGYSASNPVDPFADMARDILIRWHNGEHGIPQGMCWCSGDGKHQTFRDEWIETVNTHYWPE